MDTRYEADVIAWANEQIQLLRTGQWSNLDIKNLIKEIEVVRQSEQAELAQRMTVLVAHFLKWQHQAMPQDSNWRQAIKERRNAVLRRLQKTPSLQASLTNEDWWQDVWLEARMSASRDIKVNFETFPACCPWTAEQMLLIDWLPTPRPFGKKSN